ncbi:PKD domain-containing protein, partial [Candidatus Bathyarchaeota archaeon]
MTSSTLGNPRGSVFRFSARTTRNRQMIGRALTIIVICLALIPLVQQDKILSPPSSPPVFTTGDEMQPGTITSSIFAGVAQRPTAAITFSPSSPAAGYPVTLNATSSGGTAPYTFAWTFGDGTNGTDNPAIHTFASGGSYNVTVTIKDSAGALVRTYKIIYVNLPYPPQPAFTWTPTTVFAGETVFFDGSTSSDPDGVIVAQVWQLGEGRSQTGIGVLHTYSSPGVYEVSLSVTDDSGITVIKPMAVWVHPALALTVSSNSTQGVAPVGVSFSTQVSGGQSPYTSSWDFGDGLTSTRPNPIHNYTIPRVYRVEVTMTDSLGHTASQVMNITVIARPVELSFLGLSETTLKVGGFLTAMSAF